MVDKTANDVPSIVVLDGGFSTQLSCHIGSTGDGHPLWTARFLQTHPQEVVNTHLDFLRAGAGAIMTNTYQASVGGFVKCLGITPQESLALIVRAVELAKRARDIYLEACLNADNGFDTVKKPLIVGSVGPYGAHLHDGSEYDGSYADKTSIEEMRDWHAPRIKALVESGVDLLAFETIPCQKEAEVLLQMLSKYPMIKAWLSFSCQNGTSLAHGENFQEVATKCWNMSSGQLVAVGVNCCSPSTVSKLFKDINADREQAPIHLITYPNSGEKYKPNIGWVEGDQCEAIEAFVHEWLNIGVRYIGGCCRTYATDIIGIKHKVKEWLEQKKKLVEIDKVIGNDGCL